ncbi:MAG: aspartate aminotransferase family protein, partial [Candidatus Methylacidiphilaceae bacterium]
LFAGIEVTGRRGEPDADLAGRLISALLKTGVILLAGGPERNVLSFTPPLIITQEELDWSIATLRSVLERMGY